MSTESALQHEVPNGPWQILASDLFSHCGDTYLITADYFSKFFIILKMPQHCTAAAVIASLNLTMSEFGVPLKLVTNNGPQYDSLDFKAFATSWGFTHITSSPHYPRSNGFIERTIQTIKATMRKAKQAGDDVYMALLTLRTTPNRQRNTKSS